MPTPKCRMDMLGILLDMVAKLIPSVGTSTSTAEKWTASTNYRASLASSIWNCWRCFRRWYNVNQGSGCE